MRLNLIFIGLICCNAIAIELPPLPPDITPTRSTGTILTAAIPAPTKIELSWTYPKAELKPTLTFKVYKSQNVSSGWVFQQNVVGTNSSVTFSIPAGTQYFYRVTASNIWGEALGPTNNWKQFALVWKYPSNSVDIVSNFISYHSTTVSTLPTVNPIRWTNTVIDSTSLSVTNITNFFYVIPNLGTGVHHFYLTAKDKRNLESDFSNLNNLTLPAYPRYGFPVKIRTLK